mmetsp:Transcript_2510/g.6770  ORF Transcript_2510/g.6770 Transcript_2510/m.6770 type:complete len:201 (+) Transcript_2510:260-862(+)
MVPVETRGLHLKPATKLQGGLAARLGKMLLPLRDLRLYDVMPLVVRVRHLCGVLRHVERAKRAGLPPCKVLGRRLHRRGTGCRPGEGRLRLGRLRHDKDGPRLRLWGGLEEQAVAGLLVAVHAPQLLPDIECPGVAVGQVPLLGEGLQHPRPEAAVLAALARARHLTGGRLRAPRGLRNSGRHGSPAVPSPRPPGAHTPP